MISGTTSILKSYIFQTCAAIYQLLLPLAKKYPWHFSTSLSLYIFTIWKCIAYNFFCRDGIYFDKILVSELYFPNMCSNIPASPAYGVYISQLIRYARASSNYSDFLKRHLHLRIRLLDQGYHTLINKYPWHVSWLLYLYTFSLFENASLIIVSAETEYISTRSWYRNINFLRKSDSTHHFLRNACTKSGSLRCSQCSGWWLILSVYIFMSFDFPFVRLFGFR
jgi:hypothetical protein